MKIKYSEISGMENLITLGISIIGDWVIYYNFDDGKDYKINFDGKINSAFNETISE